ncbi:hypothetical protein DH2020_005403 [Rehmannia glutinosa]|uniref:Uncharacterized protein n=1 Tax=Rehmannia glutinosa TaxID=99300 RepID=A0ABR0XFX5_REHGL
MLCMGSAPLTSDDLDRYPAVECVVGTITGINHFDLAACRRRGIRVTSAGDVFSDDVRILLLGSPLMFYDGFPLRIGNIGGGLPKGSRHLDAPLLTTQETSNLIIIVNVGRGALIDENKLVEFLMRGEIGGAGLDVFEHEPRVPKELLALDNVVLSPHRAAFTSDSFQALEKLVLDNLHAFFSNEPLEAEIKLD